MTALECAKRLCETLEDPNADADVLLDQLAQVTVAVTAQVRRDYLKIKTLDFGLDFDSMNRRPPRTAPSQERRKRRSLETRFDGSDGYCALCKVYHPFDEFKNSINSVTFTCKRHHTHPGNRFLIQLGTVFVSSPFYYADNVSWAAVTRVVADAYVRGHELKQNLTMVWRHRDPRKEYTVENSVIL